MADRRPVSKSARDHKSARDNKRPMSQKSPKSSRRKSMRDTIKEQRRRPARRPIVTDNDEDMLSEFSDDTNTFYTDEQVERERRVKEENEARKKQKKADKRKPMSPTRRKIIRILSYGAIISVVLIIGVVLSLTVLFKTQVYEVSGTTKYSDEEIAEASGISMRENIFLAPKNQAAKRIKNQFPYVEDADVGFKIPDTITISITEAVEGYLIKENSSEYLVISTKGRILDRITDRSVYDLPVFIGPTLTSGEIGEYVSYEDDRVVTMIESITQTFSDNGYQGITEIDATNTALITFTYDNRIKVKLGIPEDLDYKIRTAMTIINEKLDKNQTGTIQGILDVSRCNTTKRSYFNEQEIMPTENKPKATEAPSGEEEWSEDWSGDWSDEVYTDDDYSFYETDDFSGYDDAYYGDQSGNDGDGNYE